MQFVELDLSTRKFWRQNEGTEVVHVVHGPKPADGPPFQRPGQAAGRAKRAAVDHVDNVPLMRDDGIPLSQMDRRIVSA